MSQQTEALAHRKPSTLRFVAFTTVAALTAALAAGASAALTLPVWAMFVGFVAFFSRGPSSRDGAINLACVWLGHALGIGSALTLGVLAPSLGVFALPIAVFIVTMIVVSLRALPWLNNILGYFLGVITFFAAHLEPSLETLVQLGGATGLGAMAGWISYQLQHHLIHEN
ncbi:DUF1097 domain-containing protein [Azotobacter armeniacus]